MTEKRRKYPVGIQTFSRLIREGYVYVDKTDLVWEMANEDNPFLFLARPRRFGKSLLASTLHSFFAGERELFRGLKVDSLEWDWQQYPVFHFDLSGAKHLPPKDVRKELERQLEKMERTYGRNEVDTTPGMRLAGLVERAHEQSGLQVVVIIDEYDAPLLDVLHEDDDLKAIRDVLQEFYQNLKMLEPYIKRCFITGITKFSQLSIFSTINNITIISMLPKYAALCGVTEEELTTTLAPDIALLAREYECTPEEMHRRLKERYDGYMFSERAPEVYNPFSLFKAFSTGKVANYWFESGTPSFLIRQMQKFNTDITALDDMEADASAFDQPTENMPDALPLLYQSGYLTIKGYDRELEAYTLGIPNQEVQTGYAEGLIPTYIGLDSTDVQMGFAAKFWRALKKGDIDLAMREMQAFLSLTPGPSPIGEGSIYNYHGKTEVDVTTPLSSRRGAGGEAEKFYEYTFYLIFNMLNVYVRTQVKCSGGRIDMVVLMPQATYVFELKMHESAQKALEQINANGYALPYETDGRRVVRVGLHFDLDSRTLDEWVVG